MPKEARPPAIDAVPLSDILNPPPPRPGEKIPPVTVIDMASKPKVSSKGSSNGYPEADVSGFTPEGLANRIREDVTDAPIHGAPGMGRDYRPTRDDPTRSVGLDGYPGDLNADRPRKA